MGSGFPTWCIIGMGGQTFVGGVRVYLCKRHLFIDKIITVVMICDKVTSRFKTGGVNKRGT